jgi:apolipoprotein N-acyltransferase
MTSNHKRLVMGIDSAHEEMATERARICGHANVYARPWPALLAAGLLLPFSNGSHVIPLAAWLAPIFLLRFVRTTRVATGIPIAFILLMAASVVEFRSFIPMSSGGWAYLSWAVFAVVGLLPFVIDRLVAPRLAGLPATLVLPSAWVLVEFIMSLTPGATWGSVAYTQYGNLPLLQVISVTGMWGITFLIGWSASICNWVWHTGWSYRPTRWCAIGFVALLAGLHAISSARLAIAWPAAKTVRVAAITVEPLTPRPAGVAWRHLIQNKLTVADRDTFRAWANRVNEDLLLRSQREAAADAKIIAWAEESGWTFKDDEHTFLERGRDLARKSQVYLGMTYVTWDPGRPKPRENKIALIAPSGEIAWQYLKSRPVPGGESLTMAGDGCVRCLDTPHGRLSAVICLDADFPRLVGQAGSLAADILLVPAGDWRGIDPLHTRMASFRAIEQGINLVRPTNDGLSLACDWRGNVLAVADYFETHDHSMIAQVPVKGTQTLYARLGDWLPWLCAGLLAASSLAAVRRRAGRERLSQA